MTLRLTPPRLAVLRALRDNGPLTRSFLRSYTCLDAGQMRSALGALCHGRGLVGAKGGGVTPYFYLTPAGLAALAEAEKEGATPDTPPRTPR